MAGSGQPVLVGALHDFPQTDGGAAFADAVRLGIDEVATTGRLDRPIDVTTRCVTGLPMGTAHAVEEAFAELVDAGALAILGPSVSDNGLVARDMADAMGIPCINYTGGEHTRGEFMFHYQVGSLEEEPHVLARHLRERGVTTVAVIHDHSPVGRRYAEFFEEALAQRGLELVGRSAVSPLADDVGPVVDRLRSAQPDALTYLGLGVAAQAVGRAVRDKAWQPTIVSNSALMFGYGQRELRELWEGWVYVDTVSDDNLSRQHLRERSSRAAAGPIGVAAFDIGRLLAEGVARAAHLTRDGLREGLERVKLLAATSGIEGTTMGFGHWDHGALKGGYLVLRSWRDGQTQQVAG
jgi:branched-chain amino acid transport system substrate-binding protein